MRAAHWNPLMWVIPIAVIALLAMLIWTLTWLVPLIHYSWVLGRGLAP